MCASSSFLMRPTNRMVTLQAAGNEERTSNYAPVPKEFNLPLGNMCCRNGHDRTPACYLPGFMEYAVRVISRADSRDRFGSISQYADRPKHHVLRRVVTRRYRLVKL